MMFDFGDVFAGPMTRAKMGEDYERSHPDGHFESNYNLLYDLAARYNDSEIQGVADWMKSMGHTGQEEWWTLAWRNPKLKATPIEKLEPWHHFPDHDVVSGVVAGMRRRRRSLSSADRRKGTARPI